MRNPVPIQRYDRDYVRDFSPLQVAEFTVRRTPLRGSPYTIYSTMYDGEVAGRQLSYPSPADCAYHVRQYQASGHQGANLGAMLDTALHIRIIDALRTREMDARDLCSRFDLRIASMRPLLGMLVGENRITRRGTARRPIYSSPAL